MRIRCMLSAAALAAGMLVAPVAIGTAEASTVATCKYRRVVNHWECVTPGAYCPAAAHGKLGIAKATGNRYRCTRYSNGRWRWKRA